MTDQNMPLINGHDSWSPLQEVWLGDVYPASWYDHLESDVRDVFQHLTEITQQDLSIIQQTIERLGVEVRRPCYDNIENYLNNGVLVKPQICPRDQFVVIGNTLWYHEHHWRPWQQEIDRYAADPMSHVMVNDNVCINGANVVRVGRDIIIDRHIFEFDYQGTWPDYRVHLVDNGGHMDGCFAILKPGLLLANSYWNDYERNFPGWEIILLDDPTFSSAVSARHSQAYPGHNGKFWDTSVGTNRSFNQHIIDHALDWVGCYTETYFELNCLVIDPSNVIMLSENEHLADILSRHGIRVHWVPFRTRSFWDGAMHCLTVDIRRDSQLIDYFPERDAASTV